MKITEYEKVQTLSSANVLLLDGTNGTKTITAENLAKGLVGLLSSQDFISGLTMSALDKINTLSSGDKFLIGTSSGNKVIDGDDTTFAILDAFAPPEVHRMVYRGKNLGTSLTDEQKTSISNGTFKGLWLGDYWTINSVRWRIVDFDYWLNTGDTSFNKHHLVIMPDTRLYNAPMNETNTTEGGYVGSLMYTTNLEQAKTTIAAAFGENVLTHREYLVNAVSNGKPSAGAWFDSTVELPNEIMIYGHFHYTPKNDGTSIPNLYTVSKTQLAIFIVKPVFANIRADCWLRDVVSSAYFADVYTGGYADYSGASNSGGVRPVFPVGVS